MCINARNKEIRIKHTKIPIKDIAKKLSKGVKSVSEDIKGRIPLYVEFLKSLASIGKNVSLDPDRGLIKIKEDFINDYLKDESVEDKGLKSIKISCKDRNASFFIELEKLLFGGIIEIPFTVECFEFSKEERTITFKFGDKKINKARNYYSQIMFWFMLSILSIFYGKETLLKSSLLYPNSLIVNTDGTYTIDLNLIPALEEIFNKDMVNIKYWDLISMDKLSFEEGMVILRLSHKLATITKISIGVLEILPAGRLIRPLINRF
ncbi:MAG: hypothetical protein ACE5KZ_11480 [Candidatus Scalinduaceae bacterium]